MKNFIAFTAILTLLISCGKSGDKGELVGVKGAKWHPEKPFGMSLVPGGSFIMGKSDQDLAGVEDASTKTVTVPSFYMDETEITNNEYRQFVEWVKDSTMRMRLAILADDNNIKYSEGKGKNGLSIGDFAFYSVDSTASKKKDRSNNGIYDKYMYENYYSLNVKNPYAGRKVDKSKKIIKSPKAYPDKLYTEAMDQMYSHPDSSYNGMRIFNDKLLKFRYSWLDIQASVKAKKRIVKDTAFPIYPDTTVWIKDFIYSYNEPMHNDYFWHKAYGDYPAVGVKHYQAVAFCEWRTMYKNSYIKKSKKKGRELVNKFRLPSEAEWEYAARGGLQSATYPWGGPYTKNDRGCFLANFKPSRGDYAADNALYTVEAKSFDPNGYNLYNMAGNVAEWTATAYDAGAYEFVSTMSPNIIDHKNKRKVVRGGSWKDVAYMLQVSTRDYEYEDSARSYIGFRTVQDYMGTQKISTRKANPKSKK